MTLASARAKHSISIAKTKSREYVDEYQGEENSMHPSTNLEEANMFCPLSEKINNVLGSDITVNHIFEVIINTAKSVDTKRRRLDNTLKQESDSRIVLSSSSKEQINDTDKKSSSPSGNSEGSLNIIRAFGNTLFHVMTGFEGENVQENS